MKKTCSTLHTIFTFEGVSGNIHLPGFSPKVLRFFDKTLSYTHNSTLFIIISNMLVKVEPVSIFG